MSVQEDMKVIRKKIILEKNIAVIHKSIPPHIATDRIVFGVKKTVENGECLCDYIIHASQRYNQCMLVFTITKCDPLNEMFCK